MAGLSNSRYNRDVPSNTSLWALTAALTSALVIGCGETIARLAHVRAFSVRSAEFIGWNSTPERGANTHPALTELLEHLVMANYLSGHHDSPPASAVTVLVECTAR